MVVEIPKITDIPFEEQTPLVLTLLESLNVLYEENQLLRDEIAALKVKNQSQHKTLWLNPPQKRT